jgi:two-component sensor histidine kinase
MVLHELAINAVRHGALSAPQGRLMVHWSVAPDDSLDLIWRELGGPSIDGDPGKSGGGMDLISGLVEFSLGGKVKFTFEPTGLVVVIWLPPKPENEAIESEPSHREASA